MKKVFFLLASVPVLLQACVQKKTEKDIPGKVLQTLQAQFPDRDNTTWETEDGKYEAEFELDEINYSVLIDSAGNMLETEVEIPTDTLPAGVKAHLAQHYPDQKIGEAARISNATGVITYEVETKDKELFFDENGNFIRETGYEKE